MMICPYCSHEETKVMDKRETGEGDVTRRRRECLKCSKRFTTYERVEMIDLIVVKKDGKREPYDRNKLKTGITKACEKRPIRTEIVEDTVNQIEAKLRTMKDVEIRSNVIGEQVMKKLKRMDKVAYIRFASVYRDFADIESFEKELEKLSKR